MVMRLITSVCACVCVCVVVSFDIRSSFWYASTSLESSTHDFTLELFRVA